MIYIKQCRECRTVFKTPEEEQRFCGRHCARIDQARHGIPSLEDKKASILSAVSEAFDKIFKADK